MEASKKRRGTRKELYIGSLTEHQFVKEETLKKLRKRWEGSDGEPQHLGAGDCQSR
jgi:hypothetical protein